MGIKVFRWLGDCALVRRLEEEEVESSRTVTPGMAVGEVVATGPGTLMPEGKFRPLTVKIGNRILFERWSGTEISLGDKEYLVVREDDILKVLG